MGCDVSSLVIGLAEAHGPLTWGVQLYTTHTGHQLQRYASVIFMLNLTPIFPLQEFHGKFKCYINYVSQQLHKVYSHLSAFIRIYISEWKCSIRDNSKTKELQQICSVNYRLQIWLRELNI